MSATVTGVSAGVGTEPVVVLKIGTSSVIDVATQVVKVSALARVAEAVTRLQAAGLHVILVSSGAVGMGCARLGLRERPRTLAGKQAAAAVGQVRLMSLYDDVFSVLGARCAQVLLTYDTFGERNQYANARNTFLELLRLGVVPVVNENDTCAVQELRVGDNDSLSALVAAMVGARWLFLLTDVDSLYTADPRVVPEAVPIRIVPCAAIAGLRRQMVAGTPHLVVTDPVDSRVALEGRGVLAAATLAGAGAGAVTASSVIATAAAGTATPVATVATAATPTTVTTADAGGGGGGGAGSTFGTGGMATKLKAAQLATAAGVTVVVVNTERVERVVTVLSGDRATRLASSAAGGGAGHATTDAFVHEELGTTFAAALAPVSGRKRWILGLAAAGTVLVDAGAVTAVVDNRKSLFPAGIVAVAGSFEAHDAVNIVDTTGVELARALVNYGSDDLRRIAGKRSKDVEAVLGYPGMEAAADRDNIVIFKRAAAAPTVPLRASPPAAAATTAAAVSPTASAGDGVMR